MWDLVEDWDFGLITPFLIACCHAHLEFVEVSSIPGTLTLARKAFTLGLQPAKKHTKLYLE